MTFILKRPRLTKAVLIAMSIYAFTSACSGEDGQFW